MIQAIPRQATIVFSGRKKPGQPPRIVIAGNGIGGAAVAAELRRKLQGKDLAQVTLIGQSPNYVFKPLLLDSLHPGKPATLAMGKIVPDSKKRSPVQFRQDAILNISIDPKNKFVQTETGKTPYDYLVISLGNSKPPAGRLEGLHEHALFIETPDDIACIRRSIHDKLDTALQFPPGSEERRKHLSFVVLGGGATGVEAALLIREIISDALKARKAGPDVQPEITMVHGGDDILNDRYFSPLREPMKQRLAQAGIEVISQHWIDGIEDESVRIKDAQTGEIKTIQTIQPISALGGVPNPVVGASLKQDKRVPVNPFLELPTRPDVYVIGDLAAAKDKDGQDLPMLGQVAAQQGQHVARDLFLKLSGKEKRRKPFSYHHRGVTLPASAKDAVMEIRLPGSKSMLLKGRLAARLREKVYRAKMQSVES